MPGKQHKPKKSPRNGPICLTEPLLMAGKPTMRNPTPGWAIVDSVMTFSSEMILEQDYDYKGSRDIIYGAQEFDNFELYVEWKIPPGGNSGIFYHIVEGYGGLPEVAPEYQLIDDENYTIS